MTVAQLKISQRETWWEVDEQRHTPQGATWQGLRTALEQDGILNRLGNREILLNHNGEAIDRAPEDVAAYVQNGNIWIDWCGWPMYSRYEKWSLPYVTIPYLGTGFGRFLTKLGFQLAYNNSINPSFIPSKELKFPYPRSLVTNVDPATIPQLVINQAAPGMIGTSSDGKRYWVTSNFMIKAGTGAYFYAYGSKTNFGIFDPVVPGVGLDTYWTFLRARLDALAGTPPGGGTPPGNGQPPGGGSSTPGQIPSLAACRTNTLLANKTDACVATLQYYLKLLGVAPALVVDSKFGAQTEAAVRAFQQNYGLTADGIFKPVDWDKLMALVQTTPPGPGPGPGPGPAPGTPPGGGNNLALPLALVGGSLLVYGLFQSLQEDED